jgi:hypothetical protein
LSHWSTHHRGWAAVRRGQDRREKLIRLLAGGERV